MIPVSTDVASVNHTDASTARGAMATALAVLRLVASRRRLRAVAASAVTVTATDNSIRTTEGKCAISIRVPSNGRMCRQNMTMTLSCRLLLMIETTAALLSYAYTYLKFDRVCCFLTVQHYNQSFRYDV